MNTPTCTTRFIEHPSEELYAPIPSLDHAIAQRDRLAKVIYDLITQSKEAYDTHAWISALRDSGHLISTPPTKGDTLFCGAKGEFTGIKPHIHPNA